MTKATKARHAWAKKLTPAQMAAVASEYQGGANIPALMVKYRIGRTTLYRYLQLHPPAEKDRDIAFWKIECQRLKELVAAQALELHDLKKPVVAPQVVP